MADSFTPYLNLRKPEVGAAFDTWGGVPGINGDMDLIDAVFDPTGGGTPVGLQLAAGKVWSAMAGAFNLACNVLFLKDATDPTKVAQFDASLIATGTTRSYKFPNEDGTLVTTGTVQQYMPTGTVLSGYYGNTPPPGFVMADGRTIGDAATGATNRANADCMTLFALLWGTTLDAQCPVTPGGRGASASADWAAHKVIALPDHSGRVMAGRDDLSGTDRNNLGWAGIPATVRAAMDGEAMHLLVASELASHTHLSPPGSVGFLMPNTGTAWGYTTTSGNYVGYSNQTQPAGSDGFHNNVQPMIVVDVIIKL